MNAALSPGAAGPRSCVQPAQLERPFIRAAVCTSATRLTAIEVGGLVIATGETPASPDMGDLRTTGPAHHCPACVLTTPVLKLAALVGPSGWQTPR